MGKTRRRYVYWLRFPKGQRQAIIGNARKGAIPPSAWDDIQPGRECFVCLKYGKLKKKG